MTAGKIVPRFAGRRRAGGGWRALAALSILALAAAGCAPASDRAGLAAAEAEALAQQGDLRGALERATEATTLADDVGANWLLLARIQLAGGMRDGAYDSYQKALESDPYNVEALRTLGAIAFDTGRVRELDRYADRLLALNASDRDGQTFKAGAAALRGDEKAANAYLDPLLAAKPDDLTVLVLKARLLAQSPKTLDQAAALIEGSLKDGGDPVERLRFLRGLYFKAANRPALRRTLARLVAAAPQDREAGLAYAALLYDEGAVAEARPAVLAVARTAADNEDLAATVLEMWRDRGADAMPVATLEADARDLSPPMKAVFAQWANERRRPDVALAILGPAAGRPVGAGDVGQAVARAEALSLGGRGRHAALALGEALTVDPEHPAALALRARFALAAGNRAAAIADLRKIVADDPQNVSARLLLAEALQRNGDAILSTSALREGVRTIPGSVRLADRLGSRLRAEGEISLADNVYRALIAAAPTSLSAWTARRRFCAAVADRRCAAQADSMIAGVQGGG